MDRPLPFSNLKLPPWLPAILRTQELLVFIGVLFYALFSALGSPVSPSFLFVCIFTVGNAMVVLHAFGKRLYANRPYPWNWVAYLIFLAFISFAASFAAVALLKWMVVRNQPYWGLFRLTWRSVVVICMGSGLVGYLVAQIQKKLRERNVQLEQAVAKGSAIIEQQEQELTRALEIQRDLLPKTLPQLPGIEIVSAWQPARTVGGDYFDVIRLDGNRLGLCIADVSGKGLTAALLMANLQAAFRAFATPHAAPSEVCAKLNEFVCNNVAPGKFITFFYGVLDGEQRSFRYENAGHCPALLLKASGQSEFLAGGGAVLGVIPGWSFKDSAIQLSPGDRLLLYTDGVTEAQNRQSEEFGGARLLQAATHDRSSAESVQRGVMEQIETFCGHNFLDDVTLIVAAIR
ncbi:MAG TPA: PP2C family protein-serine/threonine phosphatase [Terriglobales bacterium]|nr:PP2C family protein-serine/threonine phosphatase [Terriglobales bacterium]HUL14908.1 PP2C family protein-serine/threonine phosphatase [Terriglobales bacterium]